jgi:hypothetical protein
VEISSAEPATSKYKSTSKGKGCKSKWKWYVLKLYGLFTSKILFIYYRDFDIDGVRKEQSKVANKKQFQKCAKTVINPNRHLKACLGNEEANYRLNILHWRFA